MSADTDLPQGYAALLRIERPSLRVGHSTGLLLPAEIADEINSGRRELSGNVDSPDAWDRACVYPTPADILLWQAAMEAENDRCITPSTPPEPPAAHEVGGRLAPAPAATSTAVAAQEHAVRRRRVPGRSVEVIDSGQIARRRGEVGLRKSFSDDKKAELRLMDVLETAGEKRVVGLRSNWRDRIAELRADMLHMGEVIDRIEACCALSVFTRRPLRIPPLLLVGPPGVGKTYLAKKLADMLGVPEFVYQLESAETTAVLTGSEKHWANSEVGQLFKIIVQDGVYANPVIVLDELDKVTQGGNHYRPANALHAVLDRETSREIRDKCVDFVFDASYAVYIATANDLNQVGAPLVSRFEIFHISEPNGEAALKLARAIAKQVLTETGLTTRFKPLDDEVVRRLAGFKSPRRVHKVLTRAVGAAVVAGRRHVEASDIPSVEREVRNGDVGVDDGQRIALVTRLALPVLGSEDAVERWLAAPAIDLDQRKPIDVLRTDPGLIAIMTLLARMDYGVYT